MKKYFFVGVISIWSVLAYAPYNEGNENGVWAYLDLKNQFNDIDYHLTMKPQQTKMPDDDICSPTRWEQDCNVPLYNAQKEEFKGIKLRKRFRYIPEKLHSKDDTSILFLVLHGTNGQKNPKYFDNKNPVFRSIKKTAADYATQQGKKLELVSIKWGANGKGPGGLSDVDRRNASHKIYNFLKEKYPNKKLQIVTLSHSHGCNVGNCLTQLVNEEKNNNISCELGIHFACPIRKEDEYQPKYKKLLYFFSQQDNMVAPVGRIPEGQIGRAFYTLTTIPQKPSNAKKIIQQFGDKCKSWMHEITNGSVTFNGQINAIGFNTIINGKAPGHSEIVDAVNNLPHIVKASATLSPGIYELDINEATSSVVINENQA